MSEICCECLRILLNKEMIAKIINNYLTIRYLLLIFIVLLFLLNITKNIQAQSPTAFQKTANQDDLLRYSVGIPNCESARRNIEMMIEKIDKPTDTNIFAIIRLAKNERSNAYSSRRLALDRILQRYYKSIGGNYIIAESDRTEKRNGRIEFYVQGQLHMIYETKKNVNRICSN